MELKLTSKMSMQFGQVSFNNANRGQEDQVNLGE